MVLLGLLSTNLMAQEKKTFTLEDLNYGGRNYRNMVPENRYYTWWGDQLVRQDLDACYLVNPKDGTEKALLTLDEVNNIVQGDEHNRMRHLYNIEFPYPEKTIAKLVNGRQVMLVDWESKTLLCSLDRDNVQAENFSAASRHLATVKGHQLYVSDGKETKQLTTDGSREIVYGQSVHRDEFGISKGLFWSPDGKRLAFYRMDQSMVTDYPQVNIFTREATCEPDKYPMAGETSHKVTVGIYDTTTKNIVYLNAGDPTDRYFTNIAWSPDSKSVYMFELNRDQNDCRLAAYDALSGEKRKEIYRETSEKYVEPLNPIVFLPWNDNEFLMQSQRDGYNHLYIYNVEGQMVKQLTNGSFVVMEMLGFDTANKRVIVATNQASPIQRNIFAIDVKSGKRTPLDNRKGWHNAELSAGGKYIVDNYSEPATPREIVLTRTDSPVKSIKLLSSGDPWQGYNVPEYVCGTLKAADGETDLFYRMVKPVDFDPTKKYPTIVYVYGGPHAHNVQASWHYGSRGWETYMAGKGYLLFILDNRGSENRGREFEQATFRQLGQIEMADQMKGIEYLQSLPYVDADRIGVHGWSFGGFMTITLMVNHPEVFKVGVAGGPVIDWKWYEVMYGERYMDTPQTNPEGYEKTSLINKAANLKGKLQIITGYNDPTVVPQHCLSFLAECIKVGTQPDFFVYPGEPHNMRGHQSTHLHERISQYFDDYLKK